MDQRTRNFDFKKRIHYEANKYLDVLTIIQQLEKHGFVDQIHALLNNIYDEEHRFTMDELKKVAQRSKDNGEVFNFMDRYSSNANIFKQNLSVIMELFVETVWNAKMNKVYHLVSDAETQHIDEILQIPSSALNRVSMLDNPDINLKPDLKGYFKTSEEKKIKRIKHLKNTPTDPQFSATYCTPAPKNNSSKGQARDSAASQNYGTRSYVSVASSSKVPTSGGRQSGVGSKRTLFGKSGQKSILKSSQRQRPLHQSRKNGFRILSIQFQSRQEQVTELNLKFKQMQATKPPKTLHPHQTFQSSITQKGLFTAVIDLLPLKVKDYLKESWKIGQKSIKNLKTVKLMLEESQSTGQTKSALITLASMIDNREIVVPSLWIQKMMRQNMSTLKFDELMEVAQAFQHFRFFNRIGLPDHICALFKSGEDFEVILEGLAGFFEKNEQHSGFYFYTIWKMTEEVQVSDDTMSEFMNILGDEIIECFMLEQVNATSIRPAINLCENLASFFLKDSQFEDFESVLQEMNNNFQKIPIQFFYKMLESLEKLEDVNNFEKLTKSLLILLEEEEAKEVQIFYNNVLKSSLKRLGFLKTLQTFQELKNKSNFSGDKYTYSIMINGVKNNKGIGIEQARLLFEEYQEIHPKMELMVINPMLDVCVQLNAFELLEEVRKVAWFQQLELDQIFYNTLIKYCIQIRNTTRAENYYQDMIKNNINPNKITFNTLMNMYIKEGNTSSAFEQLEKMKNFGIEPDHFSWSIILSGIKKNRSNHNVYSTIKPKLRELFEDESLTIDEVFYNSIIDFACAFDDEKFALEMFNQMKDAGVVPSTVTFGTLIKYYGKKRRIDQAISMFYDLKQSGLRPNDITYGCLIEAYCCNGEMDSAEKVFGEVHNNPDVELNAVIYATMIKGFSRQKNFQKAYAYFQRMECNPNLVVFNCVIDAAVKEAQLMSADYRKGLISLEDVKMKIWEAQQFYDLLKQRNMKGLVRSPDLITYSTIIKGFCVVYDVNQAVVYFKEMMGNQIRPDLSLCNLILYSCTNKDNSHFGEYVYHTMLKLRVRPSIVTYGTLAKVYGAAGKVQDAVNLLTKIQADGLQPSLIVYTNLIHAAFINRQNYLTKKIFERMVSSNIQPDDVVFTKMVDGFKRAKQYKCAIEYIQKAESAGCRIRERVLTQMKKSLGGNTSRNYKREVQIINQHLKFNSQVLKPISNFNSINRASNTKKPYQKKNKIIKDNFYKENNPHYHQNNSQNGGDKENNSQLSQKKGVRQNKNTNGAMKPKRRPILGENRTPVYEVNQKNNSFRQIDGREISLLGIYSNLNNSIAQQVEQRTSIPIT